jgi:hypothetical protein
VAGMSGQARFDCVMMQIISYRFIDELKVSVNTKLPLAKIFENCYTLLDYRKGAGKANEDYVWKHCNRMDRRYLEPGHGL